MNNCIHCILLGTNCANLGSILGDWKKHQARKVLSKFARFFPNHKRVIDSYSIEYNFYNERKKLTKI